MATYKLTIAYDGGRFAGWAAPARHAHRPGRAGGGRSARSSADVEVWLTVAGRTDAGVHARGQVASFETDREPPDRFARRINAVLPRMTSRWSAPSRRPTGFDARRWATLALAIATGC